MSDNNLHPVMQGVFAPHMPQALPHPIVDGQPVIPGAAGPWSMNRLRTLAADLAHEVRVMRQQGDSRAECLQGAVDSLHATISAMEAA